MCGSAGGTVLHAMRAGRLVRKRLFSLSERASREQQPQTLRYATQAVRRSDYFCSEGRRISRCALSIGEATPSYGTCLA